MLKKFYETNVVLVQLNKGLSIEGDKLIQCELGADGVVAYEVCPPNMEIDELTPIIAGCSRVATPPNEVWEPKPTDSTSLRNLDTVLNKDPFGDYSGCKIKEIFDAKDSEWIERAIAEMNNEFIRKKIEQLKGAYQRAGATWL